MERVILHCDCNNFFASVELKKYPQYRGCPVAVCGSESERHGIVLAKNDIAKKRGIYTTQTVVEARHACPDLVILQPHYDEYAAYSLAVRKILERYTDLIEPFGIDEAWLDVTGSKRLFGTGEEIAERIRCEVREELGITVSIGVSFNKVFAKLGSDYKKPDAVTVISRENFQRIVYPLPVGDLLFAGRRTTAALQAMGIRTIGDLAAAPDAFIESRLGKLGRTLLLYARGEDTSAVSPEREDPKSISNGYTFPRNLIGYDECRRAIFWLCESLGTKLRKDAMHCTTVTLRMKHPDLHTVGKQAKLDSPTDITEIIADAICKLLPTLWTEDQPVRAITVGVSGLVHAEYTCTQIDFFTTEKDETFTKKKAKKENAVDQIRDRFGGDSIFTAAVYSDDGIGSILKKKH